MKKMFVCLKKIFSRNFFRPNWFSVVINPYFIARHSLYRSIYNFSKEINNKIILDLGCGNKPYSSLFNDNKYIGIDINGGGHKDSAKNIDLAFDGKNIPFGDNYFDMVICTQVLEHAKEPERLLQEANRALKNTGTLYLTCPFVWQEHEIPYDFRRYTQYGLKKILEENNYHVEKLLKTTGIFATCGQLVSSFLFELVGSNFILRMLMAVIVCFPIQLLFLMLDVIFGHKGISLDYVVIAKKYGV